MKITEAYLDVSLLFVQRDTGGGIRITWITKIHNPWPRIIEIQLITQITTWMLCKGLCDTYVMVIDHRNDNSCLKSSGLAALGELRGSAVPCFMRISSNRLKAIK